MIPIEERPRLIKDDYIGQKGFDSLGQYPGIGKQENDAIGKFMTDPKPPMISE